MARTLHKLTTKQVDAALPPGRYADGGHLYLVVTKSGSRNWAFMYSRNGKRTEMGLGAAGRNGLALANAREQAAAFRTALHEGRDPRSVRQAEQKAVTSIPSFGAYADDYIAMRQVEWRNEKHRAQWQMTLTVYCQPFRQKPVDLIDTTDVLAVLRPLWREKAETASRLRGRIENVLDAAKAEGLRSGENPARWRGHLDKLLPKRQRLSRGHHAAMPYRNVPEFLWTLRTAPSIGALAMEYLILTAARTGEVLGMTWDEIDTDTGVWQVPGERMKVGRPHRVPLSTAAIEALDNVRSLTSREGAENSSLVFPGQRNGRPISNMAMAMILRRMELPYTVHGFRSAFRDWVGEETDHPREVAEAALAHVVGDATERAYRRGDALEKRRALMDDWAVYLENGNSESLS